MSEFNHEHERIRNRARAEAVEKERSPMWQVIARELLKGPQPTMPELKYWRNRMLEIRDKEIRDGKAKHRQYL